MKVTCDRLPGEVLELLRGYPFGNLLCLFRRPNGKTVSIPAGECFQWTEVLGYRGLSYGEGIPT